MKNQLGLPQYAVSSKEDTAYPCRHFTDNHGQTVKDHAFNAVNSDLAINENHGTQAVQKCGIQCYNCKEYGYVSRECQKPKRVKDASYHKEKMLLCKQEEAGVQLNAKQVDWKDDTYDESDDQELEAHYMYMAQIQEVTSDADDNSGPIFDAKPLQKVQNDDDNYNVFDNDREHPEQPESVNEPYPVEQDEHNIIIDSLDMSYDREHDDQDDTGELAKERDLLASLIEKLKCEIEDNKNRNKFLESSNKALVDKLKGEIKDFKTKNKSLESSNNHFKEANNELSKTNQLMFKDLKKFQAELDRYHDVNYASKVEIDCAKAKGDLMSYKMESEKSFNGYTQKINDLNQTISDMKKELLAHQETISIMSQDKEAQTKFHKTRDDKELENIIAVENIIKVLDDIFLKKAQRSNPRMYDIGCYNDNLALMLAPEFDEMIRLAQESRSKLSDLIRPFYYKNLNNLYDLFVPQREKSPEQHYFPRTSKMSHTSSNNEFSKESFRKQTTLLEKRMDESIPWDQKCKSSKELFKIKKSVDTIFDGVERCKQTIAKRTYFGNIDPFIQNTIEGNFCPQIRRINADLEKFHLCLNEEMVADLRYFNSLELEVDTLKSQLETQKTQSLNEIDRLSREYYYADHINAILSVHTEIDEKHAINLELDLQQCKEKIKNDKSFKENKSNVFLKEREQYFEIQDLTAQLKDKGIAIRMYKVHTEPNQTRTPQLPQDIRKTNTRVSFSTRVIPTTSVSRPQLKINRMRDRVMLNNSQGKKQEVEDHRRNFKFSNNKTSVTACNDSLNAKTSNVNFLIEIILFIVDSGCSKHMTGNLKLLTNFVDKFLSTVKFGNDQITLILGYGDLVQGTITIKRVYYVEGLNHNLFFIGQFYDVDLEVAFRKSTCYIRDLKGNDLLTGSRGIDLYSITLQDTSNPNPICLMAKATSSQVWLCHRRLSHLNLETINLLLKNNIVTVLPKLKFIKDHLCSSCELGKAKRKSFHTKTTSSSKRQFQLLHMDLCGPMRVESINGKKYVLVIVDDYSRYT
ncbi:retrovirus-related pol polyprotein from transposon TNT 1-94 [Tanacetum coccineum]